MAAASTPSTPGLTTLGSIGSALLSTVHSPVKAVASGVSRGAGETASLLTTGKSLSFREGEAAIALQSRVRGKQARKTHDSLLKDRSANSVFACVGRRDKAREEEEEGDWLCGCSGRSKASRAWIPMDGLPGEATPPSFRSDGSADRLREEKM